MADPFSAFRKILREAAPTATALGIQFDAARIALEKADAELERLIKERVALISADETVRERNRNSIADAQRVAEEAGMLVAALSRRHNEAIAVEAEQQKLARYHEVSAKADAVAERLKKNYPRIVADALVLVRSLAEAQVEVDAVNRDLPAGASPIIDPEFTARGVPGRAREIVSDTEVERWARLDQDHPVEDAHAAKIYAAGKPGWGRAPDDVEPCYLRTRFRRLEYRESVNPIEPLSLASYLRLPAVFGPGVAWGHHQTVGYDPALHAAFSGADAPENIVTRAVAVQAAKSERLATATPSTKVEWTLLGYVGSAPLQPGDPNFYNARPSEPVGRATKFGATPFGSPARVAGGRR